MAASTSKLPPVTIVADNRETIDNLQAYFARTGVVSHATRTLTGLKGVVPAGATVVLFPDDFDATAVESSVMTLRAIQPASLVVIVTGLPQRLGESLRPDDRSRQPVVLPKPAFGWAILDAVRDQVDL